MPISILTVRVGLVSYGSNGYIFEIDDKVQLPFGLTDPMKDLVRKDLGKSKVPENEIEEAITGYGKTSAEVNLDGVSQINFGNLPFFFESAKGRPTKPSPFDVNLSRNNRTPYTNPCYVLYFCELTNWFFRGGNAKGEILEHVPPATPYKPDHGLSDHFGHASTATQSQRPSIAGIYVKNPLFIAHPDNNGTDDFNGFNFNIHMAVKQPNGHETLITIDPKIRNP